MIRIIAGFPSVTELMNDARKYGHAGEKAAGGQRQTSRRASGSPGNRRSLVVPRFLMTFLLALAT